MSELIRTRREELGLTQAQLDGLIGSSATGIAAMERQEASGEIKAKTLRHVLAAMGVELMLKTVEVERPTRLVMAETAARKTTDRIVRTRGLSGQPLPEDAIERLYQKNLMKQLELKKDDQ